MSKHGRSTLATRRDILRWGAGAAAAGLFLPSLPSLWADDQPLVQPTVPGFGKAKHVVFLYMIGGPSHFETFDPKPGTSTGGPTRTVATAIPGVEIADSLPGLAKRMGSICLLRGMTSKEGNHDRARYLVHTGYAPQPTVVHPSLGAMLSKEKGRAESDLPEYVSIGGPGVGPGYLGVHHAPFVVIDPKQPIANLDAPAAVNDDRRDDRLGFLGKVNERFAKARGAELPEAQDAMFDKARRLMDTSKAVAFEIAKEPAKTAQPYGTSRFGQSCLMARRLIEAGVTCVEVMSNGWDTHDDGFARTKALNADIDRGASALLDDLAAAGLLDSTLVVWAGDFGRTPEITSSQGRGHYPQAWSTWMAGGGVQGGRVIGATDARGGAVKERPVTIPDFFATLTHATGVENATYHSNGRPITLVDKAGVVIKEAFVA